MPSVAVFPGELGEGEERRHCERQRSNPESNEDWIASSLSLLAMTIQPKTIAL
jgi:hypothetical protein